MLKSSDHEIQNPIKPHSYPIQLKIVIIMLFAGLLYFCVFFFPKYYELYSISRKAEHDFIVGNYDEAIKGYGSILNYIKDFKSAKIKTAQAHFSLSQNKQGLQILSHVELNDQEWQMLKKYMPESLEKHFKVKKRRI